ncbi:hypothetical protein J6590_037132 [Homalodisca vitripennis]|nr:hypothetical protein J6590_037132 [Homalodisca vitripennis]
MFPSGVQSIQYCLESGADWKTPGDLSLEDFSSGSDDNYIPDSQELSSSDSEDDIPNNRPVRAKKMLQQELK